jgi:murein DD-endopeptidase MepM/ murein hydrolase activator NlpD
LAVRRRGKRKGERARLTLLLVPGKGGDVRGLALPSWVVWALGGVVGAAVSVAACFLASYLGMARQHAELARLRDERRALNRQVSEVQEKAQQVDERLRAVEDLDRQVRELIASPRRQPVSRGSGNLSSRGGAAARLPETVRLRALSRQLQGQREELIRFQKRLTEWHDLLAAIPSTPPLRGRVTSPFGARPSPFGGPTEFHDGLDLKAAHGAPVRAAAAGRVVSARFEPGYGNTITLRHGHGFTSRYAHLSRFSVRAGQNVGRGEVIGAVGSTGRSTGPHLHFMVLKNGQWCDPREYLAP